MCNVYTLSHPSAHHSMYPKLSLSNIAHNRIHSSQGCPIPQPDHRWATRTADHLRLGRQYRNFDKAVQRQYPGNVSIQDKGQSGLLRKPMMKIKISPIPTLTLHLQPQFHHNPLLAIIAIPCGANSHVLIFPSAPPPASSKL
jgi:hypothetical protein